MGFKYFKNFTTDEMFSCDTVIVSYEHYENGNVLFTETKEIKIKKKFYLIHEYYSYFKPSGNYKFILDQVDEKPLVEDCEDALEYYRNEPTILTDKESANYIGKNITKVSFSYEGKMKKLERTYSNYHKVKKFNKELKK